MSEVAAYDPGPAARFRAVRDEPDLMQRIATRMAEGETPEEICKTEGWPYSMFAQWVIEDVGRAETFARARRFWVDALAVSTVKRAINTPLTKIDIAHSKLVIDTSLRVASKLDRAQWGEQPTVQVRVDNTLALPERETMLLETARSMAYVLEAGAKLAEQRALPKPIETEPPPAAAYPDEI